MRIFDYLLLLSGVLLLVGAGHGAIRGRKDVVEVTALALVGVAVLIMGIEKFMVSSLPEWLEWLEILLLFVGAALFMGNPRTPTRT